MKINNNNIREAKRHLCGLYRGLNGVSFQDFKRIKPLRELTEAFIEDDLEIHNRTHEKSEKAANDKETE